MLKIQFDSKEGVLVISAAFPGRVFAFVSEEDGKIHFHHAGRITRICNQYFEQKPSEQDLCEINTSEHEVCANCFSYLQAFALENKGKVKK